LIPSDKELYVIDVGDSRVAPHQAAFPKDSKQYFYRQGSKSIAAPHHYLEALRNRITSAVLTTDLDSVDQVSAYKDGDHLPIIQLVLKFKVTNTARVACYRWAVTASPEDPKPTDDAQFLVKTDDLYRVGGARRDNTRIDTTILPTMHDFGIVYIGVRQFGWQ